MTCRFVVAVLLSTAACAHTLDQFPFKVTRVASNVWAAIDNTQAQASAGSNAGFALTSDGVVVIDSFANREAAQHLLADIRRATKLPIRYVINTHYHLDHVTGNSVLGAAGTVVLAQRNVRDWIHSENLRMMTEGAAATHETLTPEQVALVNNLVGPTAVYDDAIDLHVGSRLIEVRHMPGHTGGDSIVVVPDAKVVLAGDLFWNRNTPNLVDASTKPWIDTLTKLASDYSDYLFVPGHGAIGQTRDLIAFRDYLSTLRQLIADAHAAAVSANGIVDVVLPKLSARYVVWGYFKEVAPANIVQTDAELRGTKRIPRSAERQRLDEQQ
jgi:glyoxylase-like metal-dependent hydrolase (beta-lactamase superfamily II)